MWARRKAFLSFLATHRHAPGNSTPTTPNTATLHVVPNGPCHPKAATHRRAQKVMAHRPSAPTDHIYTPGCTRLPSRHAVIDYLVMARVFMAYTVMAYVVMAYVVMVYIVIAYVVTAYIVMAYIVMAYVVTAYIVMAQTCT